MVCRLFGEYFKHEKGLQISAGLFAVRGGFEPPVRLPVRQFSKLVVSATHPSHQADPSFLDRTANI